MSVQIFILKIYHEVTLLYLSNDNKKKVILSYLSRERIKKIIFSYLRRVTLKKSHSAIYKENNTQEK